MNVKHYIFAAIDLILSEDGKLYFIEANSSPGALKEYLKIYKECRPVKELCSFLNKQNHKLLAVISKKKWGKSIISNEFKKRFKGKICVCDYEKNKINMSIGDGHLIDKKGRKIMPDVVLRVAAGVTKAQEKAGIKIINPTNILKITLDKIKAKKAVERYTNINIPKYFIIHKKSDIKKILNKNKKLFSKGFVLKPQKGQKSKDVFIFDSYDKIPKEFKPKHPFILEELINPFPLFEKEFFEIRAVAVNGKYAGSMLFVSQKRPMHLFTQGRAEKTPKELEKRIKIVTEQIVKAIDKYALIENNISNNSQPCLK